VKITVDFFTNF